MRPTVIILAAGLGTRMKSSLAKALHPVAGKPMLLHVLDAVGGTDPERTVVVLGHQADRVRQALAGYPVETVLQEQQLGTGHAVRQAAGAIAAATGPVMVLCADTPLLSAATLRSLLDVHGKKKAAITLLTAIVDAPQGYGRIVRSKGGVTGIVEEKDATAKQKKIAEVNAGIYCFRGDFLLGALGGLSNRNAQNEYYLPDTIALARKKKLRVESVVCSDTDEVMGINSRQDLSRAERFLQDRTNARWMRDGVTLLDPATVFIGPEVTIGRDVVLYSHTRLEGATSLGEGCVVYPGSRITDSSLGSGVTVKDHCVIDQSTISDRVSVGPFAHLRPGTVIAVNARIGNFVEVKKSVIGEGSKANHLSYIGDATVGSGVNIGAGVITCNYDGFTKSRTVIEDDVFIGSDAQLVAPVRIGKGALVAAGATITRDVPPDALAITRVPQENKEGVAGRRRKMLQDKKAAGNR
ncbi:MAG: bifunctional UDP-N-acetylglucosamine diphosphorylase/glucosamine-1-phosphate N-acetyltransferase GlmU [Nitrospiraceae bacterium]|nr:bifunctional UDP-N-acetylglucosamine diphosphorylase/glucosamine-1-phosphate N-acetyltransferase GlmU [Nitrospiraceae bacterium]